MRKNDIDFTLLAKVASSFYGIRACYQRNFSTNEWIPIHMVSPGTESFSRDDVYTFLAETRIGGLDND